MYSEQEAFDDMATESLVFITLWRGIDDVMNNHDTLLHFPLVWWKCRTHLILMTWCF